jgi:hypothetical protein
MILRQFEINSILILLLFLTFGCSGISKTGREAIIKRAKEEASKKENKPIPQTIIKNTEPEIEELEDVITPEESEYIHNQLIQNKIGPANGKLIQVEGLVLKEVRELTIKLKTTSSQIEQITKMKDYVYENWHYIYDPDIQPDTWRSAEATLSLKYEGKYSGDCDDFSILLASFARQIGLKSRVVAGYDDELGHAFAEFQIDENDFDNIYLKGYDYRISDNAIWVSLDWFRGKDHSRFIRNTQVLYGI